MQTHLRIDMLQRSHLEMCWASYPGFDGAKGMLDGASPNAHTITHPVYTIFHGIHNGFMLPAAHPPLLARSALALQSAFPAT